MLPREVEPVHDEADGQEGQRGLAGQKGSDVDASDHEGFQDRVLVHRVTVAEEVDKCAHCRGLSRLRRVAHVPGHRASSERIGTARVTIDVQRAVAGAFRDVVDAGERP